MNRLQTRLASIGALSFVTASVAIGAGLTAEAPKVLSLKPGPIYTQMNDPNFKLISALQDRVDVLQKQLATLQRDYAAHAHRYIAPVCAYENLATFKQELSNASTSVGVCVVNPTLFTQGGKLTTAPSK